LGGGGKGAERTTGTTRVETRVRTGLPVGSPRAVPRVVRAAWADSTAVRVPVSWGSVRTVAVSVVVVVADDV